MSEKDASRRGLGDPTDARPGDTRLSGKEPQPRSIPGGIEVLLKKACVDAEFRALLLEKRSEAAGAIALELDPAEVAMLDAVPREHLDAMIRRTSVRPEDRRAFLGKVAAVMLASLAAGTSGCKDRQQGGPPPTGRGHAADRVPRRTPDETVGQPREETTHEDQQLG